ncbi:hypothetical protein ACWDTT_33250 [Streptosporangium sandarakinum]
MAKRSPADVSQINLKGCDWYEPYRGWTAQKGTACPPPVNSGQIYGHGGATPYTAEYPA